MSLIFQLNAQMNSCAFFIKYLLHVSALTTPSTRTLITSQNHLLIVRLLQWLSCRAWDIS